MATAIDLEIEIVKTTKDKDAILSQNFVYNYKNTNKDNSKHYVCNQPGCYSSITILNGYQLYIIQGLYKSNMLPCVFALLTGKSEEIYRKLILELKDGALKLSLELKPTQLTVDFDMTVKNG